MSNGKVIIVHLKAGLIKTIWCDSIHTSLKTLVALHCIKMSNFFPEPYESFGGDINVTVDLSNYATKSDLKNVTHVDTFDKFCMKNKLG